jgi:G3E family GTPase
MDERTPVTLLTGPLGAGKTTLLARLLKQPSLARTAVLLNEAGEVGLEHVPVRMLTPGSGLWKGGCVCCAGRGELMRTLCEFLPQARRQQIARVVVETGESADPSAIQSMLARDPAVSCVYRAAGVVAVLDAVGGAAHLERRPELARQVMSAGCVVVTKSDLAEPAGLLTRLRAINPTARIVQAAHGCADAAEILGFGAPAAG